MKVFTVTNISTQEEVRVEADSIDLALYQVVLKPKGVSPQEFGPNAVRISASGKTAYLGSWKATRKQLKGGV